MNAAAIAVPLVAGAVIVGATFASVPPQDRRVHWPVLGGVTVLAVAAAVLVLRRGGIPVPPARKLMPETGAVVVPFPVRPVTAAA